MPIESLNANHIGAAAGGFEMQRQSSALLYFPGLLGNVDNLITLAIASFPMPKVASGIVEVAYLNEKRKFAGMPTFDDLSIVFRDYVDKDVARVIGLWRKSVYDPVTGRIGLASEYKRDGRAVQFAPNGELEREFEIVGAWPSTWDPGDHDMEAEDQVRINVTLTIDKAIPSYAR